MTTSAEVKVNDAIIGMRNCLVQAAEQFRRYTNNHLAKNPPDGEKARVNANWAVKCNQHVENYDNALKGDK